VRSVPHVVVLTEVLAATVAKRSAPTVAKRSAPTVAKPSGPEGEEATITERPWLCVQYRMILRR